MVATMLSHNALSTSRQPMIVSTSSSAVVVSITIQYLALLLILAELLLPSYLPRNLCQQRSTPYGSALCRVE